LVFCELVETLRCIAALLQQVSHSLRKIKCKKMFYVLFIARKTIKYATVPVIKLHVHVNRQY
jgi:hypothetical protein